MPRRDQDDDGGPDIEEVAEGQHSHLRHTRHAHVEEPDEGGFDFGHVASARCAPSAARAAARSTMCTLRPLTPPSIFSLSPYPAAVSALNACHLYLHGTTGGAGGSYHHQQQHQQPRASAARPRSQQHQHQQHQHQQHYDNPYPHQQHYQQQQHQYNYQQQQYQQQQHQQQQYYPPPQAPFPFGGGMPDPFGGGMMFAPFGGGAGGPFGGLFQGMFAQVGVIEWRCAHRLQLPLPARPPPLQCWRLI